MAICCLRICAQVLHVVCRWLPCVFEFVAGVLNGLIHHFVVLTRVKQVCETLTFVIHVPLTMLCVLLSTIATSEESYHAGCINFICGHDKGVQGVFLICWHVSVHV